MAKCSFSHDPITLQGYSAMIEVGSWISFAEIVVNFLTKYQDILRVSSLHCALLELYYRRPEAPESFFINFRKQGEYVCGLKKIVLTS
jgi:hypothetical protein